MEAQTEIQKGNQMVTRKELDNIALPTETGSFKPISHTQIADTILEIGRNILIGYELESEQFLASRLGQQSIGFLTFKQKEQQEGLCIAYRNSYDKSISMGVCVGIKHPDWDSFAFKGKLVILKHTQNVLSSLDDALILAVYRAFKGFPELLQDLDRFKGVKLSDDEAFKFSGLLYGHDILSPRQFTGAVAAWKAPPNGSAIPKSLYGLYGNCSISLKSSPASILLDNYINLHSTFLEMLAE